MKNTKMLKTGCGSIVTTSPLSQNPLGHTIWVNSQVVQNKTESNFLVLAITTKHFICGQKCWMLKN
jgi:hypothetical protein